MKKFVTAAVLAVSLPMSAMAETGDRSLGLFGMIMDSDAYEMTMINVTYGQFITDSIELNAGLTLSDSGDSDSLSVNVLADYFFPTSGNAAPFVGAGANAMSTDFDDYFEIVAEGGVRIPVTESADFEVKGQITEPLDDDFDGTTSVLAGFRVKF
jgi:hypothetical protein